jgi:transcriptional regulator with XRE-family HTH domain
VSEFEKNFDGSAFYSAIVSTVVARGVTWKQVSQETGVSATTLTRMAQGRRPDAGSLAALSAWAGINPADYVNLRQRSTNPEPLARISSLLRSDPRLKPNAVVALEAMLQTAYERLKTPARARAATEDSTQRKERPGSRKR